jgi:transposase
LSALGHSRPGRASRKSDYVRYVAESGSKFRALAAPRQAGRVDGTTVEVIQAPKPEPRFSETQTQTQRPYLLQPYLYRARNLIDRFFNKIKQCLRVVTRYDKLAANYLAFIKLASIRIWLLANEPTP